MSKEYSVEGIKLPDQKWIDMKAVWDACTKADVQIPLVVWDYFKGDAPDNSGVVVSLPPGVVKEIEEEGRLAFEVDLKRLPKDISMVRFTISY